MRLSVVAACLSLCLIGFSTANDAHASIRKVTNIPAEGLGPALNALAKDRNFQIVYVTEEIADVRTQGAVGEFTTEEALKQLLTGTGLIYRYLDDKTITIGSPTTPQSRISRDSKATSSGSSDDAITNQEGKKSSSGGFRVAQVDQGQNSQSSSIDSRPSSLQDGSQKVQLTEIIVTAQKRNERLQDVPVPVSAITAESLINQNQIRLQDYYSSVPGLSLSTSDFGWPQITIRGLTTGGYTNPTVGVTVDDVPYGSSTALGNGELVPDLDPSDLERIEVLRGPQGTLYGASSIGGLLKFVTVSPSTDAIHGSLQVSGNGVYSGSDAGYGARGAVNVPLNDVFAVRASAFTRRDPGYVDNVLTGDSGVNRVDADGGRLSALWKPSQDVSLNVGALYQRSKAHGSSGVDVEPGVGDLQQSNSRGTGQNQKTLQAYSALLTAKLGTINLTAVSGYNINTFTDSFDATYILGGASQFLFNVPAASVFEHDETKKFTQEIRASSTLGSHVDWLVGGFYNHEDSAYRENILAVTPLTGVPAGSILNESTPNTFTEYAGFADVTYHFTDRFDLQIGGRESWNKQKLQQSFFDPAAAYPDVHTKDNSFTYLVTPRYKISADVMLYGRFASGYRPGGPNYYISPSIPTAYKPDTTKNYEFGIKGDAWDHALSFDASVYYIDWNGIQLQLLDPVTANTYYVNGGRAKSQGVELSTQARPLRGFTIGAWIALNDAKLKQSLPAGGPVSGSSGDRLPNASRVSGNVSVDEEFAVGASMTAFVGGTASYVGNREGVFTAPPERQELPGYAKVDFHVGAKNDAWNFGLFVNNLTDKRGVLSGGIGTYDPRVFYYIQPRTIGLTVTRTF